MLPEHFPKWLVIPIALGLALISVVLGLVLEPVAEALAPEREVAAEPIMLEYNAPASADCIDCHIDLALLSEYVDDEERLREIHIDPADVLSVHGQLGCVTCHRGEGGTTDIAEAHAGVIVDPTTHYIEECLLCHSDLPDEFPDERLRAPHDQAVHGLVQDVACSDCHGAVGHGFDPTSGDEIASMMACIECHEERDLEVQIEDCNACHIGPHDVSLALTCDDCHASIETWREIDSSLHPFELVGYHAELDCFDCHDWPDFHGLNYVCSDCHNRPHDFGDDNCASCHTPEGWSGSSESGETE